MPIVRIPSVSEGLSLRLSSLFACPSLGIGISSRLVNFGRATNVVVRGCELHVVRGCERGGEGGYGGGSGGGGEVGSEAEEHDEDEDKDED
eukprot:2349652-Pyramimonas_sp.AAC.1